MVLTRAKLFLTIGALLVSIVIGYLLAFSKGYLSQTYLYPVKTFTPTAYHHYIAKWYSADEPFWFVSARKVAHTEADIAYLLWLNLRDTKASEADYWLDKSIALGSESAALAKAEYLYDSGLNDTAFQLIKSVNNEESQSIKLRLAMRLGMLDYLNNDNNYTQLSSSKRSVFRQFLLAEDKLEQCTFPLSVYASDFELLKKWQTFQTALSSHVLGEYYCIVDVNYVAPKLLDCEANSSQPITCKEQLWSSVSINEDTFYLALMLPQGGANTYQGIMYLDAHDSFDVFIHELTHFAGFVDEYRLSENHYVCNKEDGAPFAHNLALLYESYTGDRDTVLEKVLANVPWREFLDEAAIAIEETQPGIWSVQPSNNYSIGLYPTETCANGQFNIYKPIPAMTNLRYNALPFPDLYLSLFEQETFKFNMPSYRTNIARAYANIGAVKQQEYWLQQALSYQARR